MVKSRGGVPYVFPCLKINLSSAAEMQNKLARINAGDVVIFVSVNAVRGVFAGIGEALRQRLSLAQTAAVGQRTQAALLAENVPVSIFPEAEEQNSEGLLCHPLLQDMTGRQVYIVRGQSGRETLREVLLQRGAKLEYIQAYSRSVPHDGDIDSLLVAFRSGRIQTVMLNSFAAFENLLQMLGAEADDVLQRVQLVVPGARVADKIRAICSYSVSEAKNASDREMLAAVDF